MSNQNLIEHSSTLIKNQLGSIVESMQEKIGSSKFYEYYYLFNTLISETKNYILNLGQPTFKNRQAVELPNSDDYNQNVDEITNDLTNAYQEIDKIQSDLKTNFNYNTMFNQHLKSKLQDLDNKTKDLNIYIDNPNQESIVAIDQFNNLNNLDQQATTADINTTQEQATLQKKSSKNHINEDTTIDIMSDSNGFNGNLHQAIVKDNHMGDYEYREAKQINAKDGVKFYGEVNPHTDINKVKDGNPETWFEYELCNIPESKKQNPCKGFGFEFYDKENDKWITWAQDPESGKLKLHLQVKLDEPKIINWININPYHIPFSGAGDIIIKSIKTAPNEDTKLESVYSNDLLNIYLSESLNQGHSDTYAQSDIPGSNDFTGKGVFTFNPRRTKVIDIVLEQHSPYDCKVGHIYYKAFKKVKIVISGLFSSSTSYKTKSKRVDNKMIEKKLVEANGDLSWSDAAMGGVGGMAIATGITMATTLSFSVLGPIGFIIGGILSLFRSASVNTVRKWIERHREKFDGWRWAIGLREIEANSYTYERTSKLISKTYNTPNPIKKIELNTSEQIPEQFYDDQADETSFSKRNDWIKYFISIDGGNNWHRILPQSVTLSEGVPKTYYINANKPPEAHKKDIDYIESKSNITEVKFKAEFSRPESIENANCFSPILHSYKLNLTTVKDGEQ